MTISTGLSSFSGLQALLQTTDNDSILQHALMNMAIWEPEDEEEEEKGDDDFNETYGDLDDGQDDLSTPGSDQGVDNLE
ncbi:MAG: hypothetical protein EOP48_28055 [Sphingobacteriales bacterium]|nr:MAG: hypothetical protein EOP48_28055 [Sphingobacteriales bacterium]